MTVAGWALPPPEPFEGPERCPACVGAKVTGDRCEFGRTEPRRLLVDVFCPTCGGCGRAQHDQCAPTDHATSDPDRDDQDDDESDPDEGGEAAGDLCPSCRGRRYWVALGFGGDDTTFWLRVPCGCAEELLLPVQPPT